MKVYYSIHIDPTQIEEYTAAEEPDDMKCFYITRMVETDTGEIYKDELHEWFWNSDYWHLTKKEAKEKAAKLNETLDNSKPPMTEFEKLEKSCKDRESLRISIEERKTELVKLEEQLEKLDRFIKFKQKYQDGFEVN